jgi:subtilisin family serine protease
MNLLSRVSAIAASTMVIVAAAAAPGQAAEGQILGAGDADAVPNSYIVVLKEGSAASQAPALASRFGGRVGFVYDAALTGFSVTMSPSEARQLAAHRSVAFVEQNQRVEVAATQPNPPSWGLDRIDQRTRPLNSSYTYPDSAGTGVRIYVIDTGIRTTHNDFGGRASSGFDAVDGGAADDCHGHGTHVAGTAGGTSFGVAKRANLVAVRVLNCGGSGTTAQVVAGVNWVTNNAVRPAVANMSLGSIGNSTAINNAVANSIGSGVTYAIAAGNNSISACNFSPARVPTAITVGATSNTNNDARASFSNYGTCLDIFAPGQSIVSAWATSNSATRTASGTSMASPHVAGAAALVLSANPSWSPAQVTSELVADATTGVVANPGPGSPNRLLFVG